MVDLKLRAGDRSTGGPAIHGVVIGAGLGDLDLSGDSGILPGDLGGGAIGDIDRLQLGIHQIAVILQFPQVVPPGAGQVVDINVTPVIAGVLSNGILVGVIEEEGHPTDPGLAGGIDLVDQNAAESPVGHGQGRGFAVFNGKIMGCAVHLEPLVRLGLHRAIVPGVQIYMDAAILTGSDSINQPAVHLPDLKGGVGNALGFVGLVDLDELQTADGSVIHGDGLGVRGIYRDHLSLRAGVNGVIGQGLGLLNDHCSNNRHPDLSVGVRPIQTQGGQMPVCVVHILAGGVAQFELHFGQRLGSQLIQFPNHEIPGCLVDKAEGLPTDAALDLNALGGRVQHYAVRDLDLPGGDGDARLQIRDHNAAIFIGDVLAIVGADHCAAGIGYQESDPLEGLIPGLRLQILLDGEGGLGDILHDYVISSAGGPAAAGAGDRAAVAAVADRDDTGRGIEDIIGGHSGFHHHNSGVGNQACHRYSSILAGSVAAQNIAIAVPQCELGVGHGLSSNRILFRERQGAERLVIPHQSLRIRWIHCDTLDAGGLVDDVGGERLDLFDYHRSHHGDTNLPIGIGGVQALAGQVAMSVVHIAALGIGQFKFDVA